MSSLQRGLIGALIGALLLGVLHPMTRAFYRSALQPLGRSKVFESSYLNPNNVTVAPIPDSNVSAAYWLVLACGQNRQELTKTEAERLESLATEWASKEPENAFWRQMIAVLASQRGDMVTARRLWISASKSLRWADFQTTRSDALVAQLERESGGRWAWIEAATYQTRWDFAAYRIFHAGQDLVEKFPDLETRIATAHNGRLLRDNAKSLREAKYGRDLVEISYPRPEPTGTTVKGLLTARYAMVDDIRESEFSSETDKVDAVFRQNDAWETFIDSGNASLHWNELSARSLVTGSFTAGSLFATLIGGLLMGICSLAKRFRILPILDQPNWILPLSAGLGILTYWVTSAISLCLIVAGAIAMQAFRPNKIRTEKSRVSGPFYGFLCLVFGLILSLAACSYWVVRARPVSTFESQLGFYPPVTAPAIVQLVVILASVLLLVSRAWVWVTRWNASDVLYAFLSGTCRVCLWSSLTFAALGAPVCAYFEQDLSDTLMKLRQNEPKYYWDESDGR